MDRVNANGLLQQIMRTAQLAVWEAVDAPLELISLDGGSRERPFDLSSSQTAPGAPWMDSIYPSDRARLRHHLDASRPKRPAKSVDYRLIVGDGELLWVRHWVLRNAASPEGRRHFRGLIMAIPEQKHLEWECLRVSERECNRIGQELHDDLCQVLAGLGFMMRILGQRAQSVAPALASEVEQITVEISGATDRVRSMAHGLFPAQLKYATLDQALTAFAAEARTRFRIKLTFNLPRHVPEHSPEQIIHVYRIIQEAVSNAVRHGGATAVIVTLSPASGAMRLTITNNGKGLPVGTARPEGIGMHVMQYRARALGGSLSFKTLAHRCVIVEVDYPLAVNAGNRRGKSTDTP